MNALKGFGKLIEIVPLPFSMLFFVYMALAVIQSKKSLIRKGKSSKINGKNFCSLFFIYLVINRM